MKNNRQSEENNKPSHQGNQSRVILVGLLVGLLLNITGWIGNNLLLGNMWKEVGKTIPDSAWRSSLWSDFFSLAPDFLYGLAIAWLCNYFNSKSKHTVISNALKAGIFVSVVGGITTYFAIANSGFIPWKLALASFLLVLMTKLPLAILAGKLLVQKNSRNNAT